MDLASHRDRALDAYDYELPSDRVAQNPASPRDRSRLLVVASPDAHEHRQFCDLPDYLRPGDLLVVNDTRVLAARLRGHKRTGGAVEALLLEEQGTNLWLALVRPGKRLPVGTVIEFEPVAGDDRDRLVAEVVAVDGETGGRVLRFETPGDRDLRLDLDRWGSLPLPPYITDSTAPPDRYQTIYGRVDGSAAAPTAGLHFTEELLERLAQQGIGRVSVTLHVGVGTFRPVEVSDITTHRMHQEWIEVPEATVAKIQETRDRGGRVFAVGTTAIRALESAARTGQLLPYSGKTDLFIYPGYRWQVVDGFITNFHLPKSSLLMLVSAFVGRDRLLDLYRTALAAPADPFGVPYRFYSFGDAMLVLPTAKVS
ncbi:MAG: tRNA preQ1(34) S-adenosylmethionine ribosyltransferase-isomerase QueA [Cyanophyceae cyanobacterium]